MQQLQPKWQLSSPWSVQQSRAKCSFKCSLYLRKPSNTAIHLHNIQTRPHTFSLSSTWCFKCCKHLIWLHL